MKNETVVRAYDSAAPDETAGERMLTGILESAERERVRRLARRPVRRALAAAAACLMLAAAGGGVWALARRGTPTGPEGPDVSATEPAGTDAALSSADPAQSAPRGSESGSAQTTREAAAVPGEDPNAPETYFDLSKYEIAEDEWLELNFEDDGFGHRLVGLFAVRDNSPEARCARTLAGIRKDQIGQEDLFRQYQAWQAERKTLAEKEELTEEEKLRAEELDRLLYRYSELEDPKNLLDYSALGAAESMIEGVSYWIDDYELYIKPDPEKDRDEYEDYLNTKEFYQKLCALRDSGADGETIILEYYRLYDKIFGTMGDGETISRQLDWKQIN